MHTSPVVVLPRTQLVAFAFYNVGIQNKEILGKAWNKAISSKQEDLRKFERAGLVPVPVSGYSVSSSNELAPGA